MERVAGLFLGMFGWTFVKGAFTLSIPNTQKITGGQA